MEDKYQTATATVIYGVMRVDPLTYATEGDIFRAYTPSTMGVFGTIVFLVLHIDSTQIGLHCCPILMDGYTEDRNCWDGWGRDIGRISLLVKASALDRVATNRGTRITLHCLLHFSFDTVYAVVVVHLVAVRLDLGDLLDGLLLSALDQTYLSAQRTAPF